MIARGKEIIKIMDVDFKAEMLNRSFTEETIKVLQAECICSKTIFQSLRREHFSSLLPKLKVGQHAVLLAWWESQASYDQVRQYV